MKLSELLMTIAKENSVDHFFGIPGSGVPLDLMDSGRKIDLNFINVAHESTAAIAAGTYGLLRDTAGLCLAVKGVGAANLTGGVANAYFERMPVVCICETTPNYSYDNEMVQHTDHYGLMKSVTKRMSTNSREKPGKLIRGAFNESMDGRQGPVLLNFPSDLGLIEVQEEKYEDSLITPIQESNLNHIGLLSRLISRSHNPAVIIGNDVKRDNAINEAVKLVEKIGGGVLSTMEARGVFPENHKRWIGVTTAFGVKNTSRQGRLLSNSDLIILIGVDQMMTHVPWPINQVKTVELISRKSYKTLSNDPLVVCPGNLKSSLRSLLNVLDEALNENRDYNKQGWNEKDLEKIRSEIAPRFKRPCNAVFTAQDVIEISKELLPHDGLLFTETGAFIALLENTWKFDNPLKFFGTSGGRTMGLMIPSYIGGVLATNNAVPANGLGADGSMLMRMGELETIKRCNLKWPIVIINDAALGTMKYRQGFRKYPDYGLDLTMVNFSEIAQSCGLNGITVSSPKSFRDALTKSFKENIATVIDARVDAKTYQNSFGAWLGD